MTQVTIVVRQCRDTQKKKIKKLVESGKIKIQDNALEDAYFFFGWGKNEIEKCLLKLRPSQCYDTQPHFRCPEVDIDFYRAENIMEGNNIYTHFYVHPITGYLTINSFKEK